MYEYTEVDLAELGLCGGSAEERRCLACDDSYCYVYDHECVWNFVEYTDEYNIQECLKCGTQKKTQWTYSEKDENCESKVTQTYIYTVNGKEVYRSTQTYTNTNHNFEQHYEMYGSSCIDGYRVSEVCTDCGLDSGWWSERYDHEKDWDSKTIYIDLYDTYGICGGYICRENCSICNGQYDSDCHLYACGFETISREGDILTEQCVDCGVIMETSYGEHYVVTIYYNGEQIFNSGR
jgi:hypothetical protein